MAEKCWLHHPFYHIWWQWSRIIWSWIALMLIIESSLSSNHVLDPAIISSEPSSSMTRCNATETERTSIYSDMMRAIFPARVWWISSILSNWLWQLEIASVRCTSAAWLPVPINPKNVDQFWSTFNIFHHPRLMGKQSSKADHGLFPCNVHKSWCLIWWSHLEM